MSDALADLIDQLEKPAYADAESIAEATLAEHVAIAARIRDWRALDRRIAFLTMIAERITFLGVLRNEGITLRLVDSDRFVSEPRTIPEDVRAWIVEHRAAIVAELKEGTT